MVGATVVGGTVAGAVIVVVGAIVVGATFVVVAPIVVVVVPMGVRRVVVIGTLVGGTPSSGTVLLTVVVDEYSLDGGGAPAASGCIARGSAVGEEGGPVAVDPFEPSGVAVVLGEVPAFADATSGDVVEVEGVGGGALAATLDPETSKTPEGANTVDVDATACALATASTTGVAFAVIHAGWRDASVATMEMSADVDSPPATMQPANAGRRRGPRAASRASRSA